MEKIVILQKREENILTKNHSESCTPNLQQWNYYWTLGIYMKNYLRNVNHLFTLGQIWVSGTKFPPFFFHLGIASIIFRHFVLKVFSLN